MRFAAMIAISFLLLAAPRPTWATELSLMPGVYDELLIGFDPATHLVTGYFSSQSVRGDFRCIFYIRGTLQGSEAAISTYFPPTPTEDLIGGQLLLSGLGKVEVRLPTEHGGCWNVQTFADKTKPASFDLRAAMPWISVAVVKAKKTYIFDKPGAATHSKGYLVQGDGIGVRSVQSGWMKVDFVGASDAISGWIKQSDTYSAE